MWCGGFGVETIVSKAEVIILNQCYNLKAADPPRTGQVRAVQVYIGELN